MAKQFPSQEWLDAFVDFLNTDEKYAKVASKWEGDLGFDILPDGALTEHTKIYLDLWHGKCRSARLLGADEELEAAFVLKAEYGKLVKVLKGELDPMQALMTRKLSVKGNMPYLMRNVPVVLEFVRCAQDSTDRVFGE